MTTPHIEDMNDDQLEARLDDLWRRQKIMHRMEHPDPRDPDFDLENIQVHGWRVGSTWAQPVKRGVK